MNFFIKGSLPINHPSLSKIISNNGNQRAYVSLDISCLYIEEADTRLYTFKAAVFDNLILKKVP